MLEVRAPGGPALLDEPLVVALRGGEALRWRARITDDDGLVWRSEADTAEELGLAWQGKAKRAALSSLRPVALEVRAETGRGGASRTLQRLLLTEDVVVRRWKDLGARMLRPAGEPRATLVAPDGPLTAAALLASRGALVVVGPDGDEVRERLATLPGAGEPEVLLPPHPPGVPARKPDDPAAWDALLERLGLAPRQQQA